MTAPKPIGYYGPQTFGEGVARIEALAAQGPGPKHGRRREEGQVVGDQALGAAASAAGARNASWA